MAAFDIIIVGAGHAGSEAAAAAARLGHKVAVVTLDLAHIGRLSCNPAVGGLGKGHLVRELDALGGLMARVADATCIQFRRLNTRKGLAVQASRAQVDIDRYPLTLRRRLRDIDGLTLIAGEVAGLLTQGGRVTGLKLADGTTLSAPRVILTTGTFLSGVMHCGAERTVGGRVGDRAAQRLSSSLQDLGLKMGRLKTGTTPRLDGRTIRWEVLERQTEVIPNGRFSFATDRPPRLPQIDCHLLYTNPQAHALIAEALPQSPLITGAISGRGPRYCPSIEDKIMRFPDRERHLVFLEPEGLDTHRVYPNGLSTSLPVEVQIALLRSLPGLEEVEILQPGYAVEYDFADPTDLGPDLQHRAVEGLYLAGQVNGTSGYEEAAVQGFVAGVSAARGEPLNIARDQGYIGVLVDDLTSRGVGGEPYRMFTSRAEHRLLLREDNADRRLMPLGRELGLIDDRTWAAFEARAEAIERGLALAAETTVNPTAEVCTLMATLDTGKLRRPTTVEELLRRPDLSWASLAPGLGLPELPAEVSEQIEIDVRYAGYIARAQRRVARQRALEALPLPEQIDWEQVEELSRETRDRLAAHRPRTVGQAARLPGITPAAIDLLLALRPRLTARGVP
ncbi:MAG: tRNA uridine-5-carboxymethylaminomethyl(34) synthesis enzyme MnmG [Deltaproteobacteria bacterium]|nr:MAG: tRNA uridine-5-carboxymethylaminomethyl(34) synthesis enzyme MnmG [Deltaproteobacteria bacterium]